MAAQVPIAHCIFLLEKEKDQLEQPSFHLGLVLHSNVPFKPYAALSTHRQFIKLLFFYQGDISDRVGRHGGAEDRLRRGRRDPGARNRRKSCLASKTYFGGTHQVREKNTR